MGGLELVSYGSSRYLIEHGYLVNTRRCNRCQECGAVYDATHMSFARIEMHVKRTADTPTTAAQHPRHALDGDEQATVAECGRKNIPRGGGWRS